MRQLDWLGRDFSKKTGRLPNLVNAPIDKVEYTCFINAEVGTNINLLISLKIVPKTLGLLLMKSIVLVGLILLYPLIFFTYMSLERFRAIGLFFVLGDSSEFSCKVYCFNNVTFTISSRRYQYWFILFFVSILLFENKNSANNAPFISQLSGRVCFRWRPIDLVGFEKEWYNIASWRNFIVQQ